jgi:hypothetical protein
LNSGTTIFGLFHTVFIIQLWKLDDMAVGTFLDVYIFIKKWWNPHFKVFPHLMFELIDPKSLVTCSNLLVPKDALNEGSLYFWSFTLFQFTLRLIFVLYLRHPGSRALFLQIHLPFYTTSFLLYTVSTVRMIFIRSLFLMFWGIVIINVPNILIALTVTYTKLHTHNWIIHILKETKCLLAHWFSF